MAALPVPCADWFWYLGVVAAAWWGVRAAWRLLSGARVWVLGSGAQVGPRIGKWAGTGSLCLHRKLARALIPPPKTRPGFGLARRLVCSIAAPETGSTLQDVVTGATDGIGKAYAEELARRGMCIVLISRTKEKLDDVSKTIREKFKVETKVIAADFGKPAEIYDNIAAGLKGLEIGVLVNNVGIAYEYPEYFLDIPDLDNILDRLITINITSVCKMTRLVLPGMLERSKGVILNISSASAIYPVPLLTVYSATKAFVDFFSRGLHAEYKSKGVTVQSVLPFYVATNMSKIRKPTWDKPSPEDYVKSALNTIGLQSRTNGYLPHAILGWIIGSLLPPCLYMKLAMDGNKGLRARFLKKAKKN